MPVAQPDHEPTVDETQLRQRTTPTALRIALGLQLRDLRETARLSVSTAGSSLRVSAARIRRLEMGRTQLAECDVAALLALYGVTDQQEREMFSALTRHADDSGWWNRYRGTQPSWFDMCAVLEAASSVIRTYEPQFVPALLQTEECARGIIRLGYPTTFNRDVERRVALRMNRQKLLTEPDAPSLWAVVEEAALWRLGAPSTMRAQIERLIEFAKMPNVTLQVMPFGASGHAPAGGPFSILRFAEPDLPDIVHLEQLTGALYLDERHEIVQYAMVMDRACVQAKPPAETIKFLDRIRKEI